MMSDRVADRLPKAAEKQTRVAEIRRCLQLLHEPGSVFEVRALNVPTGRTSGVISGYFNDLDAAAAAAEECDAGGAGGVYCTLNPCIPAILGRANNRLVAQPSSTTKDTEIFRRRWLFTDVDTSAPAGVMADEAERQAALNLATEIEDKLRSEGWPYPLLADSGNGRYLLHRVDLSNDTDTDKLLKAFYAALPNALSTFDPSKPHGNVDSAVINAARIIRVGGTINRKGDSLPDRPHRRCQFYDPIDECPVDIVTAEQVDAFVQKYGERPRAPSGNQSRQNGRTSLRLPRLDVPRYLQARNVEYKTKPVEDGTAYLVPCPFDSSHGRNGESAVYQANNGLLTFEWKHDSCSGQRWGDYKDAIGPPDVDHWEPPLHSCNGHAAKTAVHPKQQDAEPPPFTKLIDSKQLLAMDLRPRFIVKNVFVERQPGVIGGRSKTLKTNLAIDLVVSLGTGAPSLGEFETSQCRVGFWSGESGAAAIRETAKRVAKSKQADLADCSVWWCFELPKLSHADHLQYLAELIAEKSLDVCVLDPLYLSPLSPDMANQASSLFTMGLALQPLSELCQSTGVTVIVLHHFRKTRQPDPNEPAALEDLAQSGVAEFARQWLLLQRREPYQADGQHNCGCAAAGVSGTLVCTRLMSARACTTPMRRTRDTGT